MCFSPLAQGFGHGWDSAIYAAIGNALNKGRVLYLGIVDNKGPLLYFIDAFGLSLNYNFGIFYIEFLLLFIGTLFAYKSSLIITNNNKWLSCIAVIFSMLSLVYTLDGGNYTEEYAIFFINIATYYVIKFLNNNYEIKWYELIIIGICFSATFLLRANLCAFYVCQVLLVLFYLLKDKKYKILFKSILYILIGIGICLLPFLIYLIYNNALGECIDLVYLNVVSSFESVSLLERFIKVCGLIEITNKSNVFTIVLFAFILFLTKFKNEQKNAKILIIAFLGILLNIYVNSLTGGEAWAYTHYYISFVPIFIIICSWLFNVVYENIVNTKLNTDSKSIIILILLFSIAARPCIDLIKIDINRFGTETPKLSNMEEYIVNNSNINDTIQLIGVNDSIYYPVNRISTSKHLYFVEGFSIDRRKKDANELANDLIYADKKAKIIMLPQGDLKELTFINSLENKNEFINFLKNHYFYDEEASSNLNVNVYILN